MDIVLKEGGGGEELPGLQKRGFGGPGGFEQKHLVGQKKILTHRRLDTTHSRLDKFTSNWTNCTADGTNCLDNRTKHSTINYFIHTDE